MPVYIIPLLISGLISVLMTLFMAHYGRSHTAKALQVMVIAAGVWAVSDALEIASPGLPAKLAWARMEYLGIVAIPPAWFAFATRFLKSPDWLTRSRRKKILLGLIPALTLLLAWTNDLHHLVWQEVILMPAHGLVLADFVHGPWFWVFAVYGYLLLLAGSIILAVALIGSTRLYRWQVGIALLAILIPWLSNGAYLANLGPVPDMDWTPFTFSLAGLLFAVSLFRFQLIRIEPLAYRAVFFGLADAILVLDLDNRITDLNPAAEKLAAMRRAGPTQAQPTLPARAAKRSLVGSPLKEVLPVFAERLARDSRPLREVDPPPAEVTSAEDNRCYEMRVTTLRDHFARPIGRVLMLQDITERKQDQSLLCQMLDDLEQRVSERTEALREANEQLTSELAQRMLAENRFQTIVELAPAAILLVDQDRRILLVNAQAEHIFGCPRAALRGQPVDALIPPRLRARHGITFDQFFANPVRLELGAAQDMSALRAGGTEFPVEVGMTPLETREGRLFAFVIRDISERKQAELALRESEGTYRALFENANDAIFLLGPSGHFEQVNQKAADLLGYTREELLALSLQKIVAPSEIAGALRKVRAMFNGKTQPLFERTFRRKDGRLVEVENNISLVRDVEGRPKFIQSIVRDITERKTHEREQAHLLYEIEQSREQLRALGFRLHEVQEFERRHIAAELHDRIGQKLTGLNLNLNLLRGQMPPDLPPSFLERLDDSLQLVEETTRHVRDVLADLTPPLLDEYGLFSALRWYAGDFARRLEISVQVTGTEYTARLPLRVELVLFRIVQEALNNIARHAGASAVWITFQCADGTASLTVADDGQGFEPSLLDAPVDQPHWGLMNMRERAASVGGRLVIDSSPGRGTTVCIEVDQIAEGKDTAANLGEDSAAKDAAAKDAGAKDAGAKDAVAVALQPPNLRARGANHED